MKIIHYCQHIWGVGHFFRSLEICRALSAHEVILVTGGPEIDFPIPDHVRQVRLPGLMTDAGYGGLFPTEAGRSMDEVQSLRRQMLLDLFRRENPDFFLVELYPFGRRAFHFELQPVLEAVRANPSRKTRVVCSLRDILVEKKDPAVYEARVLETLNGWFDTLMVHSDPRFFRLEDTFSATCRISIPVVYTGFVTPRPEPGARERIRRGLNMGAGDTLIVASAGGGKIGVTLLGPLLEAFGLLESERIFLHGFTGPFMAEEDFQRLNTYSGGRIRVSRFTSDFLSYLAAADLSVSMAGYNTSMNILSAQVPALVFPVSLDREQRLRAERLAALGAMEVLEEEDLEPVRLAGRMKNALSGKRAAQASVNLDGASFTARWLEQRAGKVGS